jgi:hypothetical protein
MHLMAVFLLLALVYHGSIGELMESLVFLAFLSCGLQHLLAISTPLSRLERSLWLQPSSRDGSL